MDKEQVTMAFFWCMNQEKNDDDSVFLCHGSRKKAIKAFLFARGVKARKG